MRTRDNSRTMRRVLTILPAFNEEASIKQVLDALRSYAPLSDILVVDDGSLDETSKQVLASHAELLRLPCNLGVGAALQVGLRFAEEHGYDYTLRLDSDGQHDPEDAFRLLAAVVSGEADFAIGSRFLGAAWLGHNRNYRATFSRVLGIKLYALIVSTLGGSPITDPTSGLRCYNRRVIRYLARHHPQDYPEVESTVMLLRAGFRGVELPATIHPRIAGKSTIDFWKSVYYAFRVLLAAVVAALRVPPRLLPEDVP